MRLFRPYLWTRPSRTRWSSSLSGRMTSSLTGGPGKGNMATMYPRVTGRNGVVSRVLIVVSGSSSEAANRVYRECM